ncbi:MAG: alpha/beta hydrolase [Roseiflexaceae bacterium]|nr:alpha/beta hydrolase [Roseiflexaceae bacterium]
MPALDPQMQAVVDELVALEAPKLTDMNPANARQTTPLAIAAQTVATRQGKPPLEPVANIAHRLIPGAAGQQMLIRIYQPAGEGPFPALVYFHGGGFVIANLDVYDASCRALTNAANCAVISVAYRLGPEARFPAAHEDALAGYRWVIDNAASIRVDPARVAVGGESAGGNLATATALLARDRGVQMPVHQLLIYPITAYNANTPSYAEFVNAMPLATPALAWFAGYYLSRPSDANSPYASPLRTDVTGLPSATVITAEVDPLRDEGEAYAKKLQDAGIATTLTRYTGVTHEFFSMPGVLDKAKQAVAEAAAGLKKAFGTA